MRIRSVAAVLVCAALIPATTQAQGARFGIGATATIGLEDGGGSNFGPTAIFDYVAGGHLGFRADASYLFETGSDLLLFNGDAVYHFTTSSASMHPFLMGGLSVLALSDFDDTELGINFGAGANFHRSGSSIGFFANALFQYFFDSEFKNLQLAGGVRFGENE